MRLSAGVEVLNRLDAAVRERTFSENWPLMWGTRNRVAHGYLLVEPGIIRRPLTLTSRRSSTRDTRASLNPEKCSSAAIKERPT